MNRPRYRGAIRAFRSLPFPLPYSLRAEFVSHTSRRQNSWGIPNNADDDDDGDGAADEMFLLPIITHGEAKGSEGEASGRIDDDAMSR